MKTAPVKLLLVSALLFAAAFIWRSASHAQTTGEALTAAAANFKSGEAVAPNTAIEISLSRALQAGEKIAFTIEQTDVSGLFGQTENRFIYNAKLLPLPVGKSDLTVYLIGPTGSWKEIGRFSLAVEGVVFVEKNVKN